MTARTPRAILVTFCLEHRCETCPVNVPELGAGEGSGDFCVVSEAIESLPEDTP